MNMINEQIHPWLSRLEYYMEDENIPDNADDALIYYQCAREYLSSCFTQLYTIAKRLERSSVWADDQYSRNTAACH